MTEQNVSDFPIVDPHFHIWDITNNSYPWLIERPQLVKVGGDVDPIAKDYLIEDYLAETKIRMWSRQCT